MTEFLSSTTVRQIVANLRESREAALEYSKSFPEYAEGWKARAQECLKQLREIDGTSERLDMLRSAADAGVEL